MDRRDFFKILSTTSAGLVTGACGKKAEPLIPLLVPEEEIELLQEEWRPSVCQECSGGCGVIVRVMQGERVIEQRGERFREKIACIKKIEGNPLDPVSGGRLCSRGHAALQALYNPDRLRGPMKRSGERGRATFTAIGWDEAIAQAGAKLLQARSAGPSKIVFLTDSPLGTRSLAIERFLNAMGSPPAVTCSLADFALERKAAQLVFGWKGLPVYDLARAGYVLGIGADFLGGWASPVFYARQFGNFRQGRSSLRGRLAQAESRMSLTAASADEWLPLQPGTEPHFTVALARLLLDENLARNAKGVPDHVLQTIQRADLAVLIRACGLPEKRMRRIASELGESEAPLVIAGAPVVHTNSLQALIAAHYLNLLLGNVGRPGGILSPAPQWISQPVNHNFYAGLSGAAVVLVDNANPIYTQPVAAHIERMLAQVEMIISFANTVDDTTAYADLLLPASHTLESASAIVPAVSPRSGLNIAASFVQPLYDTRPFEQFLGELAERAGVPFEAVTPQSLVQPLLSKDQTLDEVVADGGLWLESPAETTYKPLGEALRWDDAKFFGDPKQYPIVFQPYLAVQYHDGRGANLPWMQGLPDPVSSAMWGVSIEVDPQTAAQLAIENGDWLQVESPYGELAAPAYVHPAAIPGVASMAIGQGHAHYGRYASNRGANPLAILAPEYEQVTNAMVLGGTRVRLKRITRQGEFIQYSQYDRQQTSLGHR
jgi:menaquinone reductase, molybdopterin-binding-like subunit